MAKTETEGRIQREKTINLNSSLQNDLETSKHINNLHEHINDERTYVMISLSHHIIRGDVFQKNDDLEVAEIGTQQEMRVGSRSENVNKKYNNEAATTQERKVHAI